jgi:hypothetical protein
VAIARATESALILLQVLGPVYEPIFGASGIPERVEEDQLARMRDVQLASIHHYLEDIARQLQGDLDPFLWKGRMERLTHQKFKLDGTQILQSGMSTGPIVKRFYTFKRATSSLSTCLK